MKTYDDFIAQVGGVPPFPQDVYGKVKFRVTAEKCILPVVFVVPFFILAGFFMSNGKTAEQQLLDFLEESEEIAFAEADNDFYSLFDY